jgi:parallel beta-helix repeat protein
MVFILVFGVLDAQGTPDQPILFTSDSQTPGEMDWQSIMIEESGTVRLEHITIEHSYFGLQLNSPMSNVSVNQSTFQDITTCAICGHGARALEGPVIISGNRFTRCGRECIDTYWDQNIIVRNNVFAESYVGIMSVGSAITVEGNLFINNGRGIGIIEGGTPNIIGNEFTQQNEGAAIFVTDASPTISNNNIFDNLFNFQMEGGNQNVSAANNWWGSADPTVIGDSILDGRDDPSLGILEFEPYADEAFQLDIPEYK